MPDGWENMADYPTLYKLAPQSAPADTGVYLFSDAVADQQDDPCLFAPDAGRRPDGRASMAAYLEALPGLVRGRGRKQ